MVVDQFMPINVAESCANDLEHSEMKTMCSTRTFPGQSISPSSNSVVFQVQEHSGTKTAEMHCFWVMFPVYPSVPEH